MGVWRQVRNSCSELTELDFGLLSPCDTLGLVHGFKNPSELEIDVGTFAITLASSI